MDSLQNHLLIAMPSLEDTFFERAVIYLCEHDEKGAMGIMINRPIGIDVNELLKQMQLDDESDSVISLGSTVLNGGPVNPERGFVLHTPQSNWNNSQRLTDEIMLTTSRDVLTALGSNAAPENFIVALGYAGWGRDQLEQELADNTWLSTPATKELLFDISFDKRWQRATESLGFDIWQLSSQTGHA
ncbi:YqgE/AlgH family protein [Shewanella sp. D64]|uniref:YqgE/AlgH family protein n=1 Tax=unclassified Shewanella TaxID=196818 RepID=UPI0022BA1EF6|nr:MULTISPECIES: YqgE/AlgH family protein [unclassified Shewanella]MEC4728242.1 YqgE/AlgH family protein [Shewanella sp. D64]MEC4739304.1 YqgE/AlgH family protein [Shewanella sp. E94]WBJ97036.1 YqgE/AlgH family protein [Shewanella sp. MTB7]